MLTKEQILESIQKMPEDKFEDINILTERLSLLDKIQTGVEQADNGELISLEDVMQEMKSW